MTAFGGDDGAKDATPHIKLEHRFGPIRGHHLEEKVAVVPGSAFGAAGTGYVRCSYCTAYDKLEEALVRMERFLKKHA